MPTNVLLRGRARKSKAFLVATILVSLPANAQNLVTPAAFLSTQSAPKFKEGNTLPPLTRWGWSLSYEAMVQMARWGYALEFGEADPKALDALNIPTSLQSKVVNLVREHPEAYKLSVLMPRYLQDRESDDEAFVHDSTRRVVVPRRWSPEAPKGVLLSLSRQVGANLRRIEVLAPISIILNGGERGLDVPIKVRQEAGNSPDILSAKGKSSWSDYVSKQKSYQEKFFTDAAHDAAPHAIYIFYPTGDQYTPESTRDWDWDYRWMQYIADYPSGSFYYREFNTGWTLPSWSKSLASLGLSGRLVGGGDMLTQVLNEHAYDVTFGHPLAYHWLNDGYSTDESSGNFGRLDLYIGFLKSAYTSGMLGGVAGYFAYPQKDGKRGFDLPFDPQTPPHWLLQMLSLGEVHAEFSYLEDMLRQGDLLPGPLKDMLDPALSAYEFPTGADDIRVLIRKKRDKKRWLISAWAADGKERDVRVDVPSVGTVALDATPAASLYDLRIVSGKMLLTALDIGSQKPVPVVIPSQKPDRDD